MRSDYRDRLARFFLPTQGLTKSILIAHAEFAAADEAEPDEEDTAEDEQEEAEAEARPAPAGLERREEASVLRGQFVISERLYRHLAYLARTPHARASRPFPLFKVIPSSMETLLGVEDTRGRCRPLLDSLTLEFHHRMLETHGGRYEAPWGEVEVDPEGFLLRLRARGAEGGEPGRYYEHAAQRARASWRRR